MSRPVHRIYVVRNRDSSSHGILFAGNLRLPVALGRSGVVPGFRKREGDGATPGAVLPLRRLWYRADKMRRPTTALPMRAIRRGDFWCDLPADRRYNKPVRTPIPGSEEGLWRADHLYDYIIELGWNDRPPIPGRGSAIFMHLARPGFLPTAGCVALRPRDMQRLLPLLGPDTVLVVR